MELSSVRVSSVFVLLPGSEAESPLEGLLPESEVSGFLEGLSALESPLSGD